MAEEQNIAPIETINDPEIDAMVEAGVFVGRTKTKTHPRMRPFILTTRNNVEVIHMGKTLEKLGEVMDFIRSKVAARAPLLFVGTQPSAQEGVEDILKTFGYPAVSVRWLGGTLTNYKVISKRLEHFKKLKADNATGAFEKYTKKEQLGIRKELEKMQELMSGMENMTVRPEVLVVVDPNSHKAAVREARKLNIPIVAYANTDTNPDDVDYFVPGNTRSRMSANWFLSKVKEALAEGQKEAAALAVKKEAPAA
jgi:small subunit ribosomal protein S2